MSLKAQYTFEGNANDVSGNGLNGTASSITYSTANGRVGQGAGFAGSSSSNISIGTTSSFSYMQNTGVFSVACWIRMSAFASGYEFMGSQSGSSSQKGIEIYSTSGKLGILVVNGDSNPAHAVANNTASSFFVDNNWHHIAITVDTVANACIFYKDGVVFSSQNLPSGRILSSGNSSNILTLGKTNAFAGAYFAGAMDELYFYDNVLSSSDVLALYNLYTPPKNNMFMFFK